MSAHSHFEGFLDRNASHVHMILPKDQTAYVIDTLGEFPTEFTTMESQASRYAYVGASIMLAALYAGRGPSQEDGEHIRAVQSAVAERDPTAPESVLETVKDSQDTFRLPRLFINSKAPAGCELDMAYLTGGEIMAVGKMVQSFTEHSATTVSEEKHATATSKVKKNIDYEMPIHPEIGKHLGRLHKSESVTDLCVSAHSYAGILDNVLDFSASTASSRTTALRLSVSAYQYDHPYGVFNINAASSYVVRRGKAIELYDRRLGVFKVADEIARSLHIAVNQ